MYNKEMCLSQMEFRVRSEKSDLKKVELVKGKVRMAHPVRAASHGGPHAELIGWAYFYKMCSDNVEVYNNATVHLDASNEVQPDVLLREIDGACCLDEDGYLRGPPELVAEISDTTEHIDLNDKKDAYEMCGVKEYIVWRTRANEIVWFVLRNGSYHRLECVDGLIRSETFPGLVLNVTALLEGNARQVIDTLMAINEQ